MLKQQKKKIATSISMIKKNIEKPVSEIKEIQKSVSSFLGVAQKDLIKLVDVAPFKKKINDERKQLEKTIEKIVGDEVDKVKTFVARQKKDLEILQKKVEHIIEGFSNNNKEVVKQSKQSKQAKQAKKKVVAKRTKVAAVKAKSFPAKKVSSSKRRSSKKSSTKTS